MFFSPLPLFFELTEMIDLLSSDVSEPAMDGARPERSNRELVSDAVVVEEVDEFDRV